MRISHNPILKSIAAAYIEFIRGTPVMVQLFIVYYGLSEIGIEFPDIYVLGSNFPPDLMAGGHSLIDKQFSLCSRDNSGRNSSSR